jgi:hypothetical protein
MDQLYPPYLRLPAASLAEVVDGTPPRGRVRLGVEGLTIEGDRVRKTVSVRLDATGEAVERLAAAGLWLQTVGTEVRVARVAFGSPAARVGIEAGFRLTAVLSPAPRPSRYLFYLPALLLLVAVVLAQRARRAAIVAKARVERAAHPERGAR